MVDPIANGTLTDPISSGQMVDPIGGSTGGVRPPLNLGSGMSEAQTSQNGQSVFNDYMAKQYGNIQQAPLLLPENKSVLSAGVDMGHAQMFRGGQMLAEAFNFPVVREWMKKRAEINIRDAQVLPDQIDDIPEQVVYAVGQLGAVAPFAMASAAMAPAMGLSLSAGAMAGGMMASYGMTAGDYSYKKDSAQSEEGEEPLPGDMRDVLISAALSAPDLVYGKYAKIVAPFAESIEATGKATYKAMNGLTGIAKATAKGSLEAGAVEAIQDAGGSIAARLTADAEIGAEQAKTIAEAAAQEFVVGGILGVPFSAVTAGQQYMAEKQAALDSQTEDLQKKAEGIDPQELAKTNSFQDEDGFINPDRFDPKVYAPIEGATKQPSLFHYGSAMLLGNATSVARLDSRNSPLMNIILDEFYIPLERRAPGKYTIPEKSQLWQAEDANMLNDFLSADEVVAEKTVSDRINEIPADPNDKVRTSLDNFLDKYMPEKAAKISRGKIDTKAGLWGRKDYFPNYLAIDNHKMYHSDWANTQKRARVDLERQVEKGIIEPEAVETTMLALARAQDSYQKFGTPVSYYTGSRNTATETSLINAVKNGLVYGEELNHRTMERIVKNGTRARNVSDNKDSPLSLQRDLAAFSQSFWEPSYRKGIKKQDLMRQHIVMMNDHLAHVDSFGVDNVLLDEAVAKAIMEGAANGQPIKDKAIARLYDVLRASQRIALKEMNPTLRDLMNKARAFTNISLLGLSALVSIPELIIIAMNNGALNTMKGLVSSLQAKMGKVEGTLAMNDLGMGWDQTMNIHVNRISGDNVWSIGKIEEGFFNAIQLRRLQHILTTWAARSTDIYLKRTMNAMAKGKLSKTDSILFNEKLRQAGIQHDQMRYWHQQNYDINSDFYKKQYIPAIQRLVKDTIVDPTPLDKPLWMSDPRFMLISQLKGFMTVFTNRVMRNWWQTTKSSPRGNMQLASHIAPYVAMYIAGQLGIQALKELLIKGDLEDWDEKSVAQRTLTAFGYMGGLGYFVDVYNHAKWRMDMVAGMSPALGIATRTVGDTVRALEAVNPEEALTKVLIRALPTPFNQLAKEAMGYGN